MEPVEINAGTWYLRALRADHLISDVPAIVESARDPEIRRWRHRPDPTPQAATAHIAERNDGWAGETGCSWAVCEPTTGEMLGEVSLRQLDLPMGTAEIAWWALASARRRGMTATAAGAVLRFGFDGLGLVRIGCAWAPDNAGSAAVARRHGFVEEGRLRSAWVADGLRTDLVVAGLLAHDRQVTHVNMRA